MNKAGIYAITCIASGRQYVGSAVNITNRWAVHRHGLTAGKHHSLKLQRAWNKYGADAFCFEVLELVEDTKKLTEAEQRWIESTGCAVSGFNVCAFAGNSLGRKFSDEAKAKMRAAKLGKLRSEESRRKQSVATSGVAKSPEHRRRIGEAHKGRMPSEATRLAVAEANRLRTHSPETRAKLSLAGKRRYASSEEATT